MKGPGGERSSSKQNGSTDHKLPSANTITRGKRPRLFGRECKYYKRGLCVWLCECVCARTHTNTCTLYVYIFTIDPGFNRLVGEGMSITSKKIAKCSNFFNTCVKWQMCILHVCQNGQGADAKKCTDRFCPLHLKPAEPRSGKLSVCVCVSIEVYSLNKRILFNTGMDTGRRWDLCFLFCFFEVETFFTATSGHLNSCTSKGEKEKWN